MPSITTTFTSRDFTAVYEWLLTLLQQECPELSYSDMNHSDAGVSLIRLIARATDNLSLYIDEAFSESFIHTAKFKQSLIDIARTVDLLPKMANAATTTIRVTRRGVLGNVDGDDTGIIIIPQWTAITKDNGIQYLITEEVTLDPEDTYKDVIAIQGTRVQYTLAATNFAQSLNTGRYYYNLGANVAYDTTTLVENDLITWEEVESFWRSFSDDNHFALEIYADLVGGIADTVYLTLGNGTQGNSVTSGSFYVITFIRCDGASGNTGIGTIKNIDSEYNTFVTVSNITVASGGSGVEPIEDFRLRIPKVVRTQRRAVTKEDYETLVLSVPGVKRAQAIDRGDTDDEYPWEYVVIYFIPEGGGAITESLYNTVMSVCREKGALGDWYKRYILLDVEEISVDITCTIGIEYGYSSSTVINLVTAAINSYFHVDNNEIGKVFSLGDLHEDIMAITGVSWVEFNDSVVNVYPTYGQICTVGTISITVGT